MSETKKLNRKELEEKMNRFVNLIIYPTHKRPNYMLPVEICVKKFNELKKEYIKRNYKNPSPLINYGFSHLEGIKDLCK